MPRLTLGLLAIAAALAGAAGCATPDRPAARASDSQTGAAAAHSAEAPSEYAIPKQIRYGYTLRNTTDRLIAKSQFWAYAPVPRTSHQWVEKISASQPYRASSDQLGNQILHFEFEDLPPYGTKIISITVDLKMTEQASVLPDAELARFNEPELYIESNDEKVLSIAKGLRQLEPVGSFRAAYDWVTVNLKSEAYIPEDRGAVRALAMRVGDCTEFAYLLTALGRASGVPTRPIGGYVFKDNGIAKAVDYHNWVEFFVDGRWQLADAQKKTFMQHQTEYVAMRIIASQAQSPLGESHRYSYAGEGLEVLMN